MNEYEDQFDDDLIATADDQASADDNLLMRLRRIADYESISNYYLGIGDEMLLVSPPVADMMIEAIEGFKPQQRLTLCINLSISADLFKKCFSIFMNPDNGAFDVCPHLTSTQ